MHHLQYRFLTFSGGGPPDPPSKARLASLDGPSFVPRKLLSGLTCMHAANAVSHDYKRILTIANDTDIMVLLISLFSYIGADKLWVSFGIGNKLRNISIHDICSTMSSAKAKALPAFHALAGSDNTSFSSGTGKKSAYAKWSTRPELTALFVI